MKLITAFLFHALIWQSSVAAFTINDQKSVLILIHSRTGNTLAAAEKIKEGLLHENVLRVDIKRVESSSSHNDPLPSITALPIATLDELPFYDHIIFGSPVYFHGPAAEMLAFLQGAITQWRDETLKGKRVATFFTSNDNGARFADEALRATLRALHMNSDILNSACDANAQDFVAFGLCLNRKITTTSSPDTLIELPPVPIPVGNYQPYKIVGNLVYINQVALVNGEISCPGKIGENVTDEQAKDATRITMLNVLAVLNQALNGDLSRVKQVVQISGYFNTRDGYSNHASLLNEASTLAIEFSAQNEENTRADHLECRPCRLIRRWSLTLFLRLSMSA